MPRVVIGLCQLDLNSGIQDINVELIGRPRKLITPTVTTGVIRSIIQAELAISGYIMTPAQTRVRIATTVFVPLDVCLIEPCT